MTPQEEADKIIGTYANMRADVTLGKNLEHHLRDINETLEVLHKKVDTWFVERKNVNSLYEIGYCLYRLKDDILGQLNDKESS